MRGGRHDDVTRAGVDILLESRRDLLRRPRGRDVREHRRGVVAVRATEERRDVVPRAVTIAAHRAVEVEHPLEAAEVTSLGARRVADRVDRPSVRVR